jgi:hypothetical protein
MTDFHCSYLTANASDVQKIDVLQEKIFLYDQLKPLFELYLQATDIQQE